MSDCADAAAKRWKTGETIDMAEEMTRLTLAIVGRTLFSVDVEREAAAVGKAMADIQGTFDLLSMLLLAQEEDGSGGMTDRQVRDEALTLFLAGYETTANALAWTWYLLSQHAEVEHRLHQELEAALQGRNPTFEDLPRLPYAEMVLAESMRLYPPAWASDEERFETCASLLT